LEQNEVLDLVGEQTEWIGPLIKMRFEERYWGARLRMIWATFSARCGTASQ
jgi:hypothetical protein